MTSVADHGDSAVPLDVDEIRERVEWRRTMGGRSPGVHPTLLAMEQDIDALLADHDRLREAIEASYEALTDLDTLGPDTTESAVESARMLLAEVLVDAEQ